MKKFHFDIHRFIKVFAITVVSLVFLFFMAELAFAVYFNKHAKTYLTQQIYKQTKGEYNLRIEKVNANFFNQSVFFTGVVLTPDKKINPDATKYFITAKKVILNDFKVLKYIFARKLVFDEVKFIQPAGKIYKGHKKDKKPEDRFSTYKTIHGSLNELRIHKVLIKNTDMDFYDHPSDTLPSLNSSDNELNIEELVVNEESGKANKLFFSKGVRFYVNNFEYRTKDTLYTIRIKKLAAFSGDSVLTVDSLQMIPAFNKKQFGYKAGKQTDRLDISVKKLQLKNMDIGLFLEKNAVVAKQAYVDRFRLEAYRDKNVESKPGVKKSLQQVIKGLPFRLSIGQVHVKDSRVTYEEVPEKLEKPGIIHFDNINGVLSGVESDNNYINRESVLVLNATALLMNSGPMIAHYDFPLYTDSMVFNCSAKLTHFQLIDINPTVQPLAFLTMKKGEVDTMIFNFHADVDVAAGKMEVRYHDLKISLLKHKDLNLVGKISQFFLLPPKRILAAILVKDNNPKKEGKDVRITNVYYERDPDRFIFSYTWKAILSGIKPAIGFPSPETHRINEPPPKLSR